MVFCFPIWQSQKAGFLCLNWGRGLTWGDPKKHPNLSDEVASLQFFLHSEADCSLEMFRMICVDVQCRLTKMLAARNIAPVEKCKGIKGPRQELGNIPSTARVHFFFRWNHFSSVAIGPIGLSAWKRWSHRLTQDLQEFQEIFNLVDTDRGGSIGTEELARCAGIWNSESDSSTGMWDQTGTIAWWCESGNTPWGTISQVNFLFDNVSSCAAEWLLLNFPGNLLLQNDKLQ